jgi:hypothetical protein
MHTLPVPTKTGWNSLKEDLPGERPYLSLHVVLQIFRMGVPLHDVNVGVWYAMDAKEIIGPIFYLEKILISILD